MERCRFLARELAVFLVAMVKSAAHIGVPVWETVEPSGNQRGEGQERR